MRPRVLVALLLLAVATVAVRDVLTDDDPPAASSDQAGVVERVVDGDTIRVRLDGASERVRYIGVDTPERSGRDGAECFAGAAAELNARLVAGRRVRLVADAELRDRYGRMLAYVYREPDGLFVNAELVRRGYAETLTIAPNDRFADELAGLAARAREVDAGFWGACRGAGSR